MITIPSLVDLFSEVMVDMPYSYSPEYGVGYLVDEDGNYIVDEDGNKILAG